MVHIRTESIKKSYSNWPGVIEYYREYLPVTDQTPMITLREGNTPLIHTPELAKVIGAPSKLYLKFEGLNPTGSFKDRGMTMAVSKAVEDGSKMIMCASTGNTSASAAAYAARAGIQCFVLVEGGGIALGHSEGLSSQSVQRRSVTEAAVDAGQIAVPHIVGNDDDNVGFQVKPPMWSSRCVRLRPGAPASPQRARGGHPFLEGTGAQRVYLKRSSASW